MCVIHDSSMKEQNTQPRIWEGKHNPKLYRIGKAGGPAPNPAHILPLAPGEALTVPWGYLDLCLLFSRIGVVQPPNGALAAS